MAKPFLYWEILGDWFGILNFIGAAIFLFLTIRTQNAEIVRAKT